MNTSLENASVDNPVNTLLSTYRMAPSVEKGYILLLEVENIFRKGKWQT